MMYTFGIDVGGTTVKCGLFTLEGEALDKWEIPTRTEENGGHILPDIAEAILKKCSEKDIAKEQIQGVGLAVPGPVLENGDVSCAVNLHWDYKEASRELREMTGFPVRVGNDANVAALGEMWLGGGRGASSMVMVTLGTGVGGGIVLRGRILSGVHGAAAEIGHMCVEPAETEYCNCGKRGCLEQMASATGVVRLARQELARYEGKTVLNAGKLTAKDVFDAYKEQDPVAVTVVGRMAHYLGIALANIACVVDPDIFVIGGGVSKAGQPLIDAVLAVYREYAFPVCRNIPIVLAELGNDAGIYGAAKMVMD
jgi:glucokinase